jgi:hypothetical protein
VVADGSWRIPLELVPNFKSTSSSTDPLSTDPLELGVLVEPPSFDPRTP